MYYNKFITSLFNKLMARKSSYKRIYACVYKTIALLCILANLIIEHSLAEDKNLSNILTKESNDVFSPSKLNSLKGKIDNKDGPFTFNQRNVLPIPTQSTQNSNPPSPLESSKGSHSDSPEINDKPNLITPSKLESKASPPIKLPLPLMDIQKVTPITENKVEMHQTQSTPTQINNTDEETKISNSTTNNPLPVKTNQPNKKLLTGDESPVKNKPIDSQPTVIKQEENIKKDDITDAKKTNIIVNEKNNQPEEKKLKTENKNIIQKNNNKNIKPEPQKEEITYTDWHGSLMYNVDSLRRLKDILKDISTGKISIEKKGGIKVSGQTNKTTEDILGVIHPQVSPSFYLNSIIFQSPTDWVIWLNDHKISYSKRKEIKNIIPEIEILKVSADSVILQWKTSLLDIVSPGWQLKLEHIDEDYTSLDREIYVNSDHDTVTFKLNPNQTFVVYDMEIEEGYVGDIELSSSNIAEKIINKKN